MHKIWFVSTSVGLSDYIEFSPLEIYLILNLVKHELKTKLVAEQHVEAIYSGSNNDLHALKQLAQEAAESFCKD